MSPDPVNDKELKLPKYITAPQDWLREDRGFEYHWPEARSRGKIHMHVQIWTRTGLSIRTTSHPNIDKAEGFKFVTCTVLYGHENKIPREFFLNTNLFI